MVWIYLKWLDESVMGPVPSKDVQTPLLSEVAIFKWKMRTMLNQMKNHISDFYFLGYGWMYLQFTVTNLDFQLCPRQKKIVQKWLNLQERCAMSWNEWKVDKLETYHPNLSFWDMFDYVLKFRTFFRRCR